MKIGLIGLGKMGGAIAHRLIAAGHEVIAYDHHQEEMLKAQAQGCLSATSALEVAKCCRVIWLMIPHERIDELLKTLVPTLKSGDIIVDGGNSYFKDTVRRARMLARKRVYYIDCGTSGGIKGKELGFSLMVGGNEGAYKKLRPLFKALAAPDGYGYMGPTGAGHYVKMIHNGIEYVLLQAYADGFMLLKEGGYKDLDLERIARVFGNGSVIRSWIVDLLEEIFEKDQNLTDISGAIGENKTGQWTLDEAHEQKISSQLLDEALKIRAWSRATGGNFSTKLVALLRNKFGGHEVSMIQKKKNKKKG